MQILKLFSMASLLLLTACSAHEVESPPTPAEQPPKPMVSKQTKQLGLQPVAPHEVAVRLCSDVSNQQVEKALSAHRVVISHRSSPELMTLAWQDSRTIEQVIDELKQEPSVFCAVQPNYKRYLNTMNKGTMGQTQ